MACFKWMPPPPYYFFFGLLAKVIAVGWLFWAERLFETVFQSVSGRSPVRGRKKRKMIDERKIPHPHLLQAQ